MLVEDDISATERVLRSCPQDRAKAGRKRAHLGGPSIASLVRQRIPQRHHLTTRLSPHQLRAHLDRPRHFPHPGRQRRVRFRHRKRRQLIPDLGLSDRSSSTGAREAFDDFGRFGEGEFEV